MRDRTSGPASSTRPARKRVPLGPTPMEGSKQPTREDWDKFIAKEKPDEAQVRQLVRNLHRRKQHQQVINLIESALVNGQSQAWMYDVLAISMEIVDRPKAEIERVLLSRVDFTATDVPSMLISAAYLTRFGAKNKALELYQQASDLATERPEPYVLGLELAKDLKDYDSVGWAASGILTYGWTSDFRNLHRKAENAAEDARQALLAKGDRINAGKIQAQIQEAKNRDLQIQLRWNGPGDLDLVVEEPLGTVCSATRPQSPGGGVLVHDGAGPKPTNSYDAYVCALAAPGTYNVHVRHIRGEIVAKRATLTVVRYAGTSRETRKTLAVPLSSDDVLVRIPLSSGRRKAANAPTDRMTVKPAARPVSSLDQRRARSAARNAARSFNKSRRMSNTGVAPTAGTGNVVGFQPIIQNVNSGVSLSVGAVISADRRYVRLSLSPSFSSLVDVFTFSAIQ